MDLTSISTSPPLKPLTVALYTADVWEHVCPMLRVIRPLQVAGAIVLRGSSWQNGELNFAPQLVAEADIVVMQRNFPHHTECYRTLLKEVRTHQKILIYDLDDLLMDLPTDHPDYRFFRPTRAAIADALLDAHLVTCSTAPLADQIAKFGIQAKVLPNFIDDEWWLASNSNAADTNDDPAHPIVIGYCGGHSHRSDLEMIAPALLQLLDRYAGQVVLKFWGIHPPELLRAHENVHYDKNLFVSYAEFVDYFRQQQVDILIAPLRQTVFNQCKSALKFLEYSALGVPGVYSAIEPYSSVVKSGENGFLAETLEEWQVGLTKLIESKELRSQVGQNAKQCIIDDWRLLDHAQMWIECYLQAHQSQSSSVPTAHKYIAQQAKIWHEELEQQVHDLESQSDALSAENAQLQYNLSEVSNAGTRLLQELSEAHYENGRLLHLLSQAQAESAHLTQVLSQVQTENTRLNQQLAETSLENTHLSQRLMEQEQQNQRLAAHVTMIETSLGWRLMQTATPLRYRLIPSGSRREVALQKLMGGVGVLQKEGLQSFARRSGEEINYYRKNGHFPRPVVQEQQPITVIDGTLCPSPAITILLIENGEQSLLLTEIRQWLQTQTWQANELVVWNSIEGKVKVYRDHEELSIEVDANTLLQTIEGRYLCLASKDLLAQSPTYLEENLIALECGQLAFTINTGRYSIQTRDRLAKKQLPGNSEQPLLRLMVRKDCLTSDLQVDLTAWLQSATQSPLLVAKIIAHTSEEVVKQVPFANQLVSGDLHFQDDLILGWGTNAPSNPQATLSHFGYQLFSVDTLLDMSPIVQAKPVVLMVLPVLAVGGAERVHLYLLEQLYQDVCFVIVTLETHDLALGTTADQFRKFTPYVYTLSDFLPYPLNFSMMRYLLERFQPQTLYIANGTTWIYDALSTIKQFYPKLHIANQVYDGQAGWINRYDAQFAKDIDAHIGTNTSICQAYVQRGALPEQVHLIEHCVDIQEYDAARYSEVDQKRIRTELGVKEGCKIVTFMARLHPQKRPMDFVELARRFASNPSLVFLLIGDGPLAEAVDAEVARIGLKNMIRRPFYRPSSDIFAISDVYVLPSEYEGMPLVILEAQAMGRPVVVTDVGNNREVIECTQGGIVVNRIGDVGGIYQAVQKMLEMPPSPQAIREAVVNQLSQKHSILPQQMAAKYREVLLPV